MRKVIGIGESILDIIFKDDQPVKAIPGGSVFNTMISLGRCRIPAYFISELGNDKVGRIIRKFMDENHLNSEYIDFFQDGNSPVALAFLDREQNAQYQFYKNFPKERLQVSFPEIKEGDILILGSYFAVNSVLRKKVVELLQYASARGAIIYYDINFRKAHAGEKDDLMNHFQENFKFASLVRCSEEDLSVLFPDKNADEIYEKIISPLCPNFIVTQGEKEICLFTESLRKTYSVKPTEVVSTIGAGDSFNAGIIFGMMQEKLLSKDLSDIKEEQWNLWIDYGRQFAEAVCKSIENYIPIDFSDQV
ncbi:carbohydrate kinase [Bacteroidales bacterium OttesenSCG-928-A17]|nr:carbohydrate kinase [Bacteroidales bacterium OttesenSCG-928-A17]